MKLAGTRKTPALGRLIALAIIALGVAALAYAWHRSANYPPPTAPASTPTWSTSPRPSAAAWSACRSRRTSASPRAMCCWRSTPNPTA